MDFPFCILFKSSVLESHNGRAVRALVTHAEGSWFKTAQLSFCSLMALFRAGQGEGGKEEEWGTISVTPFPLQVGSLTTTSPMAIRPSPLLAFHKIQSDSLIVFQIDLTDKKSVQWLRSNHRELGAARVMFTDMKNKTDRSASQVMSPSTQSN